MKLRAIAILALVLLTAATLSAQQAVIQEEKQIIKTYPFYGGDPAPIMTRSNTSR